MNKLEKNGIKVFPIILNNFWTIFFMRNLLVLF